MRVQDGSTVWVRPEMIETIVLRNCPGDTSVADQLLNDWREDHTQSVIFDWHTKYTGRFYVSVINRKLQLFDNEVIRCEL